MVPKEAFHKLSGKCLHELQLSALNEDQLHASSMLSPWLEQCYLAAAYAYSQHLTWPCRLSEAVLGHKTEVQGCHAFFQSGYVL